MCKTKIYHPNIDFEGNVCLNILRKDYNPTIHTQDIIQGSLKLFLMYVCIGLSFLFYDPEMYDPLNEEAAKLMGKNIETFKAKVQNTFRGGDVDGFVFFS
jgi:ubiquitin-conjugating enzyme E2 M